jgi:hypothetical protein
VLGEENALARMEAASSWGGDRHKRYSGQPEIAPEKETSPLYCYIFNSKWFVQQTQLPTTASLVLKKHQNKKNHLIT